MKHVLSLLAIFVLTLVSLVSAYTPGDLQLVSVEIDGEQFNEGDLDTESMLLSSVGSAPLSGVDNHRAVYVEEGETMEVEVVLRSVGDVRDVRVEAEVSGYEFDDNQRLEDRTSQFDIRGTVNGSTTRRVNLNIPLPSRLEDERYVLRLRVTNRENDDLTRYVVLQVEPPRRGLRIADVAFSPGNAIKAGRSLLTTVLLENYGEKDERDVKVTVAIPALGVSATEFVDAVDTDDGNVDYEDVPEMFLSIPANTQEGDYDVVVTAGSDAYGPITERYTVHVAANEQFQPADEETLVLAVGPEMQNVFAGKTVRYAVALTNAGSRSKAYLLSSVAGDWAMVSLSDALVVLEPGKNQVVYVDVTPAASATPGTHTVPVAISADNEVLETVSLGANVVSAPAAAQSNVNLRNGLEIALIVLVVVLVIIGLIIGFSRLRREESGDDKTYY